MNSLIQWQDDPNGLDSLAPGIPDGCRADITGGTAWKLSLQGKPIRGVGANLAACKEAVWQCYIAWVMPLWFRGRPQPGGRGYLCPLK